MSKYETEIKWAVIFSLASLAWVFLEKTLGWHDEHIQKQTLYTNLFALVAITIYFLALLEKRKIDYNGKMTWRQGFLSGAILSVIIALFSPLVQYVAYSIISPQYFEHAVTNIVASGKMSQVLAEGYYNLQSFVIQGVFGALSMGIVTSGIVAFFVKKQ